jgi:non-heme chloroperoxidase
MSKLLEKTLILPNGLEISYGEHGNRRGPALILLHGYSDSFRSQNRLVAHLPEWLRTVAISLRGHGESSKTISTYRTAEHAGDVARVMDALAIDSAVIAGHSMGSLIAQRFALDFPERVQGLVLLGAFRTLRGNAGFDELCQGTIEKLENPVDPAFVRAFQESTIARPIPPAFLEMAIAESLKLPAFVWRKQAQALREEDFSAQLAKVATKTLVVWGDQDTFTSYQDQLSLCAVLKHAELHVLRGTGHAVHWEDPKAVAAFITRFVRTTLDIAA